MLDKSTARRPLMPLAWFALLLLSVGMLGWLALHGPSPVEDSILSPGVQQESVSEAGKQGALLSQLAAPENEDNQVRVGAVEAGLAPMAKTESIDSVPTGDDVIWIEGVVRLDPATPSDERLHVIARGRIFSDSEGRREHRVTVAGDGFFRVAVSKRTKKVRFSLSGRYSYLKAKETWRVGEGQLVELFPELGAHVHVRVVTGSRPITREDGLVSTLEGASYWQGNRKFHLGNDGGLAPKPAA